MIRKTSVITRSVIVHVLVLVGVLVGLGSLFPIHGALLASITLALSVCAEWGYLTYAGRKSAEELRDRFS